MQDETAVKLIVSWLTVVEIREHTVCQSTGGDARLHLRDMRSHLSDWVFA